MPEERNRKKKVAIVGAGAAGMASIDSHTSPVLTGHCTLTQYSVMRLYFGQSS